MSLKFIIEKEEDVPKDHAALYVVKDGKWILDVEGAEPASRVKEFRDNNIKIQKELDKLKADFKDVDLEKWRDLSTRERELMEGEVYKKDGLDAAVAKRTEAMRADHEKLVTSLNGKIAEAEKRLALLTIDGEVSTHASRLGLKSEALPLISLDARQVFRMEDGQAVAYEPDGKTKRYGADGQPLTVKEYMELQLKERAFLFKESTGGGSTGSGNGGGDTGGPNPWAQATFNRTLQHKMLAEDPAKAKRMQAAAGVK